MAKPEKLSDTIRSQLIAARKHGYSEEKVELDDQEVPVIINSTSLQIMVCTGPLLEVEAHGTNILNTVRHLLGHPPDAVFTRGRGGDQPVDYCAVWGNPELSFREELSSLVLEIYTEENQVVFISERLRTHLVPDHPREWTADQIDLWRRFWALRLENPYERERIALFSHPDTWDYFQLLSGKLATITIREMTSIAEPLVPQQKIEETYRTAALAGYQLFILGHPELLDFSTVAFSQVSELVPDSMDWESISEPVLQVLNEINISDIRTAGDLFKQAALMPPKALDKLLLNANKCTVLGYTTAAVAHRLKAPLC